MGISILFWSSRLAEAEIRHDLAVGRDICTCANTSSKFNCQFRDRVLFEGALRRTSLQSSVPLLKVRLPESLSPVPGQVPRSRHLRASLGPVAELAECLNVYADSQPSPYSTLLEVPPFCRHPRFVSSSSGADCMQGQLL